MKNDVLKLKGNIRFLIEYSLVCLKGRLFYSALRTPHSALRTPHSALRTPHSLVSLKRNHILCAALKSFYGHGCFSKRSDFPAAGFSGLTVRKCEFLSGIIGYPVAGVLYIEASIKRKLLDDVKVKFVGGLQIEGECLGL